MSWFLKWYSQCAREDSALRYAESLVQRIENQEASNYKQLEAVANSLRLEEQQSAASIRHEAAEQTAKFNAECQQRDQVVSQQRQKPIKSDISGSFRRRNRSSRHRNIEKEQFSA